VNFPVGDDPFMLDEQLHRRRAHESRGQKKPGTGSGAPIAQDKLLPRICQRPYLEEEGRSATFFHEMGELGLNRHYPCRKNNGLRQCELRPPMAWLARGDRARSISGYRSMNSVQSSLVDAPESMPYGDENQRPRNNLPKPRHRGMGRLLRP